VVAERATLATGMFQRMKGLLGRSELGQGEGLIIRPCNGVHTCFMRFSIDVIFLDKEGRAIKLQPELAPFKFTPIVGKSRAAMELPAGTIARSGTQLADQFAFQ